MKNKIKINLNSLSVFNPITPKEYPIKITGSIYIESENTLYLNFEIDKKVCIIKKYLLSDPHKLEDLKAILSAIKGKPYEDKVILKFLSATFINKELCARISYWNDQIIIKDFKQNEVD